MMDMSAIAYSDDKFNNEMPDKSNKKSKSSNITLLDYLRNQEKNQFSKKLSKDDNLKYIPDYYFNNYYHINLRKQLVYSSLEFKLNYFKLYEFFDNKNVEMTKGDNIYEFIDYLDNFNKNISQEIKQFSQTKSSSLDCENNYYILKYIEKPYISNYVSKLEYLNIKNISPEICTVFIYDWDDTMFPTSYLNQKKYNQSIEISPIDLIHTSDLLCKIIEKSLETGKVYIVTNSMAEWIHYSCRKYIPNVEQWVDKVEVISARQLYEYRYPRNKEKWKHLAFKKLCKEKLNRLGLYNIIVVGDSDYEIESAQIMKQKLHACLKTIKFKEMPLIQELSNQLELLYENMPTIISRPTDLTIRLIEKD